MPHFKKRPVVIEAVQYTKDNGGVLAMWCGGRERFEAKASDHTDVAQWIDIPTLEGVMRANLGSWIVRGVKGEYYAVDPDIFEETYERVDSV